MKFVCKRYTCEYGCGYGGEFDDVANHEKAYAPGPSQCSKGNGSVQRGDARLETCARQERLCPVARRCKRRPTTQPKPKATQPAKTVPAVGEAHALVPKCLVGFWNPCAPRPRVCDSKDICTGFRGMKYAHAQSRRSNVVRVPSFSGRSSQLCLY